MTAFQGSLCKCKQVQSPEPRNQLQGQSEGGRGPCAKLLTGLPSVPGPATARADPPWTERASWRPGRGLGSRQAGPALGEEKEAGPPAFPFPFPA